MDSIAIPWGAEVGLITWRTVRQHGRPPLPSEILASFVVFGAFSLVSAKSPQVGSLLGWGIVIATALNFFPATPKSGSPNTPATPTPGGNSRPRSPNAGAGSGL